LSLPSKGLRPRTSSSRSASKGKTIKDATQAILDFSTATGRDATSAAQLLGRALANPAKAGTILQRAIGKLTPAEEKLLKATAKTKSKLDDQNAIIRILESRYAGSFAKAGDTAAGKQAKLGLMDLVRARVIEEDENDVGFLIRLRRRFSSRRCDWQQSEDG
jgi:hypothetical protein